jgi:chloramphenicol 3-O-phosphotransferase
MTILVVTGPPASGKTSVAPLVARQRQRCAIIDVDQVRWMLVQPHAAPWEGEEGKRQCRFGVENACLLATRFAEDGCDVVLLDFIWDYTINIYRQRLAPHPFKIVQLMPSLEETLPRNHARGWLPAHEVEMLYAAMESFHSYDMRIDNTRIAAEELARYLLQSMEAPGAETNPPAQNDKPAN